MFSLQEYNVFIGWKFWKSHCWAGNYSSMSRKVRAVWGPGLTNPYLPWWALFCEWHLLYQGIPGSSVGKESTCNVKDLGLIPGLGKSQTDTTEWFYFLSLFSSISFVLAVAMYPSAENQVCLEQLREEVSESWVSLTFFLTTHQNIREEHWFVHYHDLKYGSCPDHILGCWKIATAAMTFITHLDWVLPLKNKRSGRVWGTPEKILLA